MATNTPNAPQFTELRTSMDVVQRGFKAIQTNQGGPVAIPDNIVDAMEAFPRVQQWIQKQEKQYPALVGEQTRSASK